MIPQIDYVIIERLWPEIDAGRYPIKRVAGDELIVEADILSHGHEIVRAVLRYRKLGETKWNETPLTHLENDRWGGSFILGEVGTYEYTIFAWRDPFLSWQHDLRKKFEAGLDVTSELLEGKMMVEKVAARAEQRDSRRLRELLLFFEREVAPASAMDKALDIVKDIGSQAAAKKKIDDKLSELEKLLQAIAAGRKIIEGSQDPIREIILGPELEALMSRYPDQHESGNYPRIMQVIVDRREAEFASWYEMWPRSQGTAEGKSATFDDMALRLPEIKELGFNVIYLPPIHPIGVTNRKGPNNSLICPPGSPGCPYAIGSTAGGHKAIEPSLGSLDDFRRFEAACRGQGMEIALDFALQTSPDHPWVKEHPSWFNKRPDGSIKFAENPPKKYEDIYPINFATDDREGLWREILDTLKFWMERGVRIFRVDNPHTKPVYFWEWLINEIRRTDPDVLFLAEAFTRPKMMKALAKAGFTQSYTYFTWRNFKQEIIDYFHELSHGEMSEYFRGNLFTNTPDILPKFLQNAPRSAFKIRAALAATLGSTWGIYNGFELCEGTPLIGKEEYADSEKYQYKVWDWHRPGHIKDFIAQLNRIRREQPALQKFRGLQFYQAENDNLLWYSKFTPDKRNILLIAVNLDPYHAQEGHVHLPLSEFSLDHDETFQMHELISDRRFMWRGERNFVRLDPASQPAQIFKLLRWSHREQDFDYFI